MRKRLFVATCFLAGTLISGQGTATGCDELWAHTCYGMSVQDVLKAVPHSTSHPRMAGKFLFNGANELVLGPKQTIDGEKFLPHFYFANNRLVEVILTMESGASASWTQLIFENLIDDLRAKYGKELSLRSTAISRDGMWLNHGTNIDLTSMYIEGGTPTLSVVYQRRISEDAGHL